MSRVCDNCPLSVKEAEKLIQSINTVPRALKKQGQKDTNSWVGVNALWVHFYLDFMQQLMTNFCELFLS